MVTVSGANECARGALRLFGLQSFGAAGFRLRTAVGAGPRFH